MSVALKVWLLVVLLMNDSVLMAKVQKPKAKDKLAIAASEKNNKDTGTTDVKSRDADLDDKAEKKIGLIDSSSDLILDDDTEEDDEDDEDEDDDRSGATGKDKERREEKLNKGPKIWDQWSKWSACSVTCGIGKIIRWRHCVSGGCAPGEKEAQIKTCTLPAC